MPTNPDDPCTYENDGKYIIQPGKFEGEPRYVPDLWHVYLDGGADEDVDGTLKFIITDEDRTHYPELASVEYVILWEDDNGFVHSHVFPPQ